MAKRILITLGMLNVGGAEVRTLQFLQGLREAKLDSEFTVFVYVVSGRKGSLDQAYTSAGARVIYGRPGIRGISAITRLCRRHSIDMFIANAALAGGFYCAGSLLGGVKRRISYIRSTSYDRTDPLIRARNVIYRLFLNIFSTEIVGVCASAQVIAGAANTRWSTIYNGVHQAEMDVIDARRVLGWSQEKVHVVFLGRLHRPKNPRRAVEIARCLWNNYPQAKVQFHLIGRDDMGIQDQLPPPLQGTDFSELIQFHPETDCPLLCVCAASVLLLPSTREGLPGVVLEALAAGTPVVASDLPGVQEIAERVSGVEIVSLDKPDSAWVEALLRLPTAIERDEIKRSFAASPFSFRSYFEETLALWRAPLKRAQIR
jgi:glycosyltransferase involved in cell wall biosynthesis